MVVVVSGEAEVLDIGDGGGLERGFLDNARMVAVDVAGVDAEASRRLGLLGVLHVLAGWAARAAWGIGWTPERLNARARERIHRPYGRARIAVARLFVDPV